MLSKLKCAQSLLKERETCFCCPLCRRQLKLNELMLSCPTGHTFNLSKKGIVRLLPKEHRLQNNLYDRVLFSHRRSFIDAGFYNNLHILIRKILDANKALSVLDLGCGEGTHLHHLCLGSKMQITGVDLAVDGIQMATDYLKDGYLPLVADVYHLPFQDASFDAVVDILSPFVYTEVTRLLKNKGVFIKVAPGQNYLKEVREIYKIPPYEQEQEVYENLCKHFAPIKRYQISDMVPLSSGQYEDLIYMTPLLKHHRDQRIDSLKKITIDLNVYVIKKEG